MSPFGVQYTTERGSPFLLRKSHSTVRMRNVGLTKSTTQTKGLHAHIIVIVYVNICARVVVVGRERSFGCHCCCFCKCSHHWLSMNEPTEHIKKQSKMCECVCVLLLFILSFSVVFWATILSIHSISEVKFFIVVYNLHIQIRKQLLLLRMYIMHWIYWCVFIYQKSSLCEYCE